MLTINQQRTVQVPVTVLYMHWERVLKPDSVAAGFPCSACGSKLGGKRWGAAFIRKESGVEHSMRLCEDCGVKAESDLAEART